MMCVATTCCLTPARSPHLAAVRTSPRRSPAAQGAALSHGLKGAVHSAQRRAVSSPMRLAAQSEAGSNNAPVPLAADDVVIVSACRTPMAKAKVGLLRDTPTDELVSVVLKEVVHRAGVSPEEVGDICFGSGLGPSSKRANQARIGMFLAGFPNTVPVYTLNRHCASGLQAIADVAAAIKSGYIDIGIAGGVESMSLSPMAWEGSDNPKMAESQDAQDCMLPMGVTSDNVAERYNVPREVQDALAVASHAQAAAAQAEGRFKREIVPVTTTVKDPNTGEEQTVTLAEDDGIRSDFTMQKLSKMRACFRKGGTTTVGNSCQVTDGAAAVLLMKRSEAERRGLPVLATLRSFAAVGVPPAVMGIGPALAVPAALRKAGLTTDDVDIYEINEAFGSQAAYCVRELGLPEEKVNPNGGGIALGHPIGCTGARQTVTLVHELQRRNSNGNDTKAKYGVVSMCTGSGMGAAAVFEAGPGTNGKV